VTDRCRCEKPSALDVGDRHRVSCWLVEGHSKGACE
jgi:hypothetical protein